MWWNPENFQRKRPYLEKRAVLIRTMRGFFENQGFLEVETPALQPCPGMDTHIHGMKVPLRDVGLQPLRDLYLHTSPEFAMKKLLVAGLPKIFQLCHAFRDGEETRLHSPEFTMIEWYRTGAGYRDIMNDCIELLRAIATALNIKEYWKADKSSDPFRNWEIISVADAFRKYAGMDLEPYLDDAEGLAAALREVGIRTAPDDAWDDLFFRVMAEKIEPFLGFGAPCILCDYPVSMAALARRKPEDPRFAERFELYVCGVELANAFGELTDPVEQRARFIAEMADKQEIYGESYPLDEDFLKALELGMPESSGIALGVDRLVMLATGAEDIDQVLWAGKP